LHSLTSLALALVPASSVMLPPTPELPDPTSTEMLPPVPTVAVPVLMASRPESPSLVVPVLKIICPLTPNSPALAVCSTKEPELDAVPTPVLYRTLPPRPPSATPPWILMSPPMFPEFRFAPKALPP
jgi:hypothetical protein